MSSRVFSCKFEVVTETKSTESLGASVDVSGQLLGIVPFLVRIEDKWTMGSFLLLGGSIEKYLNIENLIKIVSIIPSRNQLCYDFEQCT
jgi:hypothetical protein